MDSAENFLPSTSLSGIEETICTPAQLPSMTSTSVEGIDTSTRYVYSSKFIANVKIYYNNNINFSVPSNYIENLHSSNMAITLPEQVNKIVHNPATAISVPYLSMECKKEVEHVYVQAKPETRIKSTQTDKEIQIRVSSRNVGVTSSCTEERNLMMEALKVSVYEKYTKFLIEDNPSLFIGINKESMFVIDLLQKVSNISVRNIYLTLKKIKTNHSFLALSYEFSTSECQTGKVFKTSVHTIAKFLKELILWPSATDISLNLTIQFRCRYSDVQSTIDCFEIEIEKPSDAVNQALTWSDYKKCNTAKYLISVTPDGLINFISEGACGRGTDMAIVENSGYLDKLPANTSVLANRSFKQLDVVLNKKQCKLIRPPSVKQDVKSTKKEVKLTKQIASIRIHVERVINRIRNFQLLNIHTRVDNHLLGCLDSCVIIAAALVNMQSEIIKQS